MAGLHCIDISDERDRLLEPQAVATGFREQGRYFFHPAGTGQQLYIDDAPLQPETRNGLVGWTWSPGFYAGRVQAEWMDAAGAELARFQLDVAADDRKLGSEIFARMLKELTDFNPGLPFGTEAAQSGIGVEGELMPPMLAYARLHRYGMDLVRTLQPIIKAPLTRLRQQRTMLPYQRVRRLDTASVRGMLRHGASAALLIPETGTGPVTMPRIDVAQSVEHLDNPPNQAISGVLLAVRQRCREVCHTLQVMAERNIDKDQTRTPLKPRLDRRLAFLQQLEQELNRIARQPPFVSVSRCETSAAGLNAISAHPAYARAYRFGWSVLRPGIAGIEHTEQLWLSPTWEIYERWCFSRLAICLQKLCPTMEWQWDTIPSSQHLLCLSGDDGRQRLKLVLQCRFHAGDHSNGAFRSVSASFYPDLVLTQQTAGQADRMLILDAKYRTSRTNVLDAMRSAHVYQDALRWNDRRPVASLLLIPRGGGAPWLEDPAFQTAHRVGIQVLDPAEDLTGLSIMLTRWLGLEPAPSID